MHVVQLGDEPVQIAVDAAFDDAVIAEPRLSLRYASDDQARGSLLQHAVLLGREVRAEDVVLVGSLAGEPLLLRVRVRPERLVAGSTLAAGTTTSSQAADALTQTRFVGVRPDLLVPRAPAPTPAAVAEMPAPAARPQAAGHALPPPSPTPAHETALRDVSEPKAPPAQRGLRIGGSVLLTTGLATLGTGLGLTARSNELRDAAEAEPVGTDAQRNKQQKYDDFRYFPLIGTVGSALATASVPMLLRREGPRTPAAWVGGALAGVCRHRRHRAGSPADARRVGAGRSRVVGRRAADHDPHHPAGARLALATERRLSRSRTRPRG